jgi:hypothetical protein
MSADRIQESQTGLNQILSYQDYLLMDMGIRFSMVVVFIWYASSLMRDAANAREVAKQENRNAGI